MDTIDLKHWQACLAIDHDRLSGKTNVDIKESGTFLGQSYFLTGALPVYKTEVQEHGERLIRIHCAFIGELATEENNPEARAAVFEQAQFSIATSFKTFEKEGQHVVAADLNDPNLQVTFRQPGAEEAIEALVETLLNQWLTRVKDQPVFELFRFNPVIAQSEKHRFEEIKITTCYASHSPEFSSVILLMRERAPERRLENELVIDPHILPNGQTCSLWITDDFMNQINGPGSVEKIKQLLKLNPGAMKAEIAETHKIIPELASHLAQNIFLEGKPLEFTSVEHTKTGTHISATPLSLDELVALTAVDDTQNPRWLVMPKVNDLLQEAVLFYMKDNLREHYVKMPKPKRLNPKHPEEFIQAYRDATEPYTSFLQDYGKLQVSLSIKDSPKGGKDPFNRLTRKQVREDLNRITARKDYEGLSNNLMLLAFCQVRPRISLYLNDTTTDWKQVLYEHLKSDAFAERLMWAKEPLEVATEAQGKLALFDRSGKLVEEIQDHHYANMLDRIGERRAEEFALADPKRFKRVLDVFCEEYLKVNNQLANSSEASVEERETAKTINHIVQELYEESVLSNKEERDSKWKDPATWVAVAKKLSLTVYHTWFAATQFKSDSIQKVTVGENVFYHSERRYQPINGDPGGREGQQQLQSAINEGSQGNENQYVRVLKDQESIYGFARRPGVDLSKRVQDVCHNEDFDLKKIIVEKDRELGHVAYQGRLNGEVNNANRKGGIFFDGDEPTKHWWKDELVELELKGKLSQVTENEFSFKNPDSWKFTKSAKLNYNPDEVAVKLVPRPGTGMEPKVTVEKIVKDGYATEQIVFECDPEEPSTYETQRVNKSPKTLIFGRFMEIFGNAASIANMLICWFGASEEKNWWDTIKNYFHTFSSVFYGVTSACRLTNLAYKGLKLLSPSFRNWIQNNFGSAPDPSDSSKIIIRSGLDGFEHPKLAKLASCAAKVGNWLLGAGALISLGDAIKDFWNGHNTSGTINLASAVLTGLSLFFVLVPIPPMQALVAVAGLLLVVIEILYWDSQADDEAKMAFDDSVDIHNGLAKLRHPPIPSMG